MTYATTILASSPLRYWPLNETSGTSATDLVASEVGTATGLTMGGGAGPDGIGGVAPVFTGGTEHITLRANKLLGGSAAFTVEAWVYYDPASEPDATLRAFYGEQGTSGNDAVIGELSGGTSGAMNLTYGDDTSAPTIGSNGVFLRGRWVLLHFTRSGTTIELWWNGGRRTLSTAGASGSTWTNAGPATWLGNRPRGSHAWIGRIAHVATYTRVLSQSEIIAHYEAGTPLTRPTASKPTWKPTTSIWNQDLLGASTPTIDGSSAATVTKLVAQVTGHGAAASFGGGPVHTVTNAQATQRVRIVGGSANNPSSDHPALYNALGVVPVPADLTTGPGVDIETSIYNSDTDELWEFWQMTHDLLPPSFISAANSGSGSLAAGNYHWGVTPIGPGNTIGTGDYAPHSPALGLAVGASGRVVLNWDASEGAVGYQITRDFNGAAGQFITDVGLVTTFTDDGTITPTTYSARPTTVMSDWGCFYAGYMAGTNTDVGHWRSPRANWGASATSLPLTGGHVKLSEGAAHNIPHAITMALAEIVSGSHVYPAQRNDGSDGANAIQEGTRFQLDPAYDTSTIANAFERAVAVALQKYGGYVRDVSGAVTGCYVEADYGTGRDFGPIMYDGKWDYELFSNSTFPWASCRVIDPAWTLAQTAVSGAAGPYWGILIGA